MLIIDLTFYEVIGFNRVLFDEVWSIRDRSNKSHTLSRL